MAAAERSCELLAGVTEDMCVNEFRTSVWTLLAAALNALLLVVGMARASDWARDRLFSAPVKVPTSVEATDLPPETDGVPAEES